MQNKIKYQTPVWAETKMFPREKRGGKGKDGIGKSLRVILLYFISVLGFGVIPTCS